MNFDIVSDFDIRILNLIIMELKEYLTIFRKHFKLFITITVLFIAAGILFQLFRPLNYKAVLNLNITRTGKQETSDYRYDNFYRLQADEKFADTVVRWLESPEIAARAYNDSQIITAGLSHWRLSRIFKSQRLSSQAIKVSYTAKNADTAKNLSSSIIKVINSEAEELNKTQNEETWFVVVGDNPIIRENKWPWEVVILASILIGIFFGFWMVLVRHYLQNG